MGGGALYAPPPPFSFTDTAPARFCVLSRDRARAGVRVRMRSGRRAWRSRRQLWRATRGRTSAARGEWVGGIPRSAPGAPALVAQMAVSNPIDWHDVVARDTHTTRAARHTHSWMRRRVRHEDTPILPNPPLHPPSHCDLQDHVNYLISRGT
mgnify:CR=1 FL=1